LSTLTRSQDLRLIGRSEAIRAIEHEIDCAARSDAKVLITGETGVGKEVVSRLIHRHSTRSSAPLVTLNCAGLPDSMAPNGTVFLDEVGEMSPRMQVVLLRFLETGEIQRVGSDRSHTRVNVRLITATNRDLETEIRESRFREDLFFRLNVIRFSIPPLRDRRDDIPLLVNYFLQMYGQMHNVPPAELSPDAMDALVAYRWPGNIRELKNVVERLVVKSNGGTIQHEDLPFDLLRTTAVTSASSKEARRPSQAEDLSELMLKHGESFWAAVHPLFMSRDITRADLRKIVQIGLECTNGNYRMLVERFNMPIEDYKRFLSFLRKHDCHLPFQRFRAVPARYQHQDADPLRKVVNP
jgi:DNA-binding NtrC family response regulator